MIVQGSVTSAKGSSISSSSPSQDLLDNRVLSWRVCIGCDTICTRQQQPLNTSRRTHLTHLACQRYHRSPRHRLRRTYESRVDYRYAWHPERTTRLYQRMTKIEHACVENRVQEEGLKDRMGSAWDGSFGGSEEGAEPSWDLVREVRCLRS